MNHGGEAARPTTMVRIAGVVQGSEANIGSQLGVAATAPPPGSFGDLFDLNNGARYDYDSTGGFAPRVRAVAAGRGELRVPTAAFHHLLHLHRQPGPGVGVAYDPNDIIGDAVPVLVVGPQQLPGGGGGGAVYDDGYHHAPLPRSEDAGHGDVLVYLLPVVPDGAGAGRGEAFVDLPRFGGGGGGAVHDDCGYYLWEPRRGAGRGGEVFIGVLPEDPDAGDGVVLDGSAANLALPGPGRTDGIAAALRGPNLGAGAVYDDGRGKVGGHLRRRLLPLAGIGACAVAVNGLAAAGPGTGTPAVSFGLFALLLGGLFLIILHVRLRA